MNARRKSKVRWAKALGLIAVCLTLSVVAVNWQVARHQSLRLASALVPGVTLRPIDGGPNYYCSNGFTNACSSSFNGMSWDDPRFFPIGQDYSFYPNNSVTTFKDLGLNYTVRVTDDTDLTMLRNAGIWAIPTYGEGKNPGPETVGWHIEEPASWSAITQEVQQAGGSIQGRFLQPSFTWNQFAFDGASGTPGDGSMQATMSSAISTAAGNVHLDLASADQYWFAGSNNSWMQTYSGPGMYKVHGPATADQMARGSNYGDMVDSMRGWMQPTSTDATTYSAPVCPYIETDDGLVNGGGVRRITPSEFNWAVWSTIVHGARCLMYFSTTSNYGDGNTFGFSKSVMPGQTTSMYNQAVATNGLVKNLAPIINSPFALGYASVTPAGYTFPVPHLVWDNGIDTMTKYYTGGNYSNSTGNFSDGYYTFASVRGSEAQANIHATFKTADGYSGPVTVVGENRTVPASNGVFSDTFASATTVHVYQVPASGDTAAPVPPVTASSSPATTVTATPMPTATATSTPTETAPSASAPAPTQSGTSTPAPSATTGGQPPAPPSVQQAPGRLLVGNSVVQSGTDNDGSGSAEAFRYTADQTGTVTALSVYVAAGTTATSVKVGLYTDAGGHPGRLLDDGTIANPKSGSWNTASITKTSVTAGTKYWLALLGTGGQVNFRDLASGGGPTENSAQTALSSLPSTWSTGQSYGNAPASFYATATVTSTPTPTPTKRPHRHWWNHDAIDAAVASVLAS